MRIEADAPEDAAFLQAYMARDRGRGPARRGRAGRRDVPRRALAGRGYGTTLLDENAASHMAFGSGFDFARDPGAERPNSSRIHVDVMIGRPELEVHGRDASGRRVAVLVDGVLLPA